MATSSVLDILIYVFDRYMLAESVPVPGRARLACDLQRAGFAAAQVERALDWLTELAFRHGPDAEACAIPPSAVRVFTDSEAARLSVECRGFLLTLERMRVLTAMQREIVIERLLALGTEQPEIEQLQWVVLMVLSSQPGHEGALARLGQIMAKTPLHAPH